MAALAQQIPLTRETPRPFGAPAQLPMGEKQKLEQPPTKCIASRAAEGRRLEAEFWSLG